MLRFYMVWFRVILSIRLIVLGSYLISNEVFQDLSLLVKVSVTSKQPIIVTVASMDFLSKWPIHFRWLKEEHHLID